MKGFLSLRFRRAMWRKIYSQLGDDSWALVLDMDFGSNVGFL
jgi:hypothetical protein